MRKKYLLIALTSVAVIASFARPASAGIKLGAIVANGDKGVLILKLISKNGYGAKIGLKAGDEITMIGINKGPARKILDLDNLLWSLNNTRDRITVYWLRDGKYYQRTLYRAIVTETAIVNGREVMIERSSDWAIAEEE